MLTTNNSGVEHHHCVDAGTGSYWCGTEYHVTMTNWAYCPLSDLLATMTHEIGHTLGMDHNLDCRSIMTEV